MDVALVSVFVHSEEFQVNPLRAAWWSLEVETDDLTLRHLLLLIRGGSSLRHTVTRSYDSKLNGNGLRGAYLNRSFPDTKNECG